MEEINLSKFLSLFDCKTVNDCWLNSDCIINESGITAKNSYDDNTGCQSMHAKLIELDFSCTALDLICWAHGVDDWEIHHPDIKTKSDFVKRLSKEFVDKWELTYRLFRVICGAQAGLKEIKYPDEMIDVDWSCWLDLSKEWTAKQAILLIFGFEPQELEHVKINQNDLTRLEQKFGAVRTENDPLYKLLRLPKDLKKRSLDWLIWFDANGYLKSAPEPLLDWYKEQLSQMEIKPLNGGVQNGRAGSQPTIEKKSDKQIDEICETAKSLDYDLLNIPEGGKAKIKAVCLEKPALFTKSAFDHAWKEANKRKLISMQDKEKYLSNQ